MPRWKTRDRPAPGGQSPIGGHARWWRPGRSATSALQPMRAHRDYSPDRDKYVRMGRERPHLRRRASYPNVRPRAPAPAFCPLRRGARPCRPKPSCSGFKPSISSCQRGRTRVLIRPRSRQRFSRRPPPRLRRKARQPSFGSSASRSFCSSTRLAAILTIFSTRGHSRRRGQTCARSSSRPMRPRSVRAALNTDSEK